MSEQKPICGNCRHWSDKELKSYRPLRECKRNVATYQAFRLREQTCEYWRGKKK